ncbi:MAG: DinB family protein [Dehalococcoidia bacterium]
MGKAELIRALFEHNEWANDRLLDAASQVSEEELTRVRGPDCGSLQDILMHILASHLVAIATWKMQPPALAKVESGKAAEAMRESYSRVHATLRELVDSLTDESLDASMEMHNPTKDGKWRTWQRPAWQVALSLGSHAMQHRGEAAMILTELGHSPGEIDYSYYCWRSRDD